MTTEQGTTDRVIDLVAGADAWHASYELVPERSRPDAGLYGGTALAAVLDHFEMATGRPGLWATVQFVAQTTTGTVIEHELEPMARGRTVDQLRLTARVDGAIVYTALGACGTPRADATDGTGPRMPDVAPPEGAGDSFFENRRRAPGMPEVSEIGFHQFVDILRVPYPSDPVTGRERPGRIAMWARMHGRTVTTPASLGFLADMVPVAISHAAGVEGGGGFSIDNTLRVGHPVDCEWILLDMHGHASVGGFGYGAAHLWSPDGVLLGTASQTSKMFAVEQG